jgi:predicted DsbA family dithiol-disulfide isomerase
LDPEALQQATEVGQFRVAVDAQINEARALGISAVPAYIFNDRYAIIGAQPYEAFREMMGRLTADVEHEP